MTPALQLAGGKISEFAVTDEELTAALSEIKALTPKEKRCKQAGLIGAVSTTTTFVNPNSAEINYPYQLPRFGFPNSFLDFIQYSSWIERAKV